MLVRPETEMNSYRWCTAVAWKNFKKTCIRIEMEYRIVTAYCNLGNSATCRRLRAIQERKVTCWRHMRSVCKICIEKVNIINPVEGKTLWLKTNYHSNCRPVVKITSATVLD
jgi:hypothetical protein